MPSWVARGIRGRGRETVATLKADRRLHARREPTPRFRGRETAATLKGRDVDRGVVPGLLFPRSRAAATLKDERRSEVDQL